MSLVHFVFPLCEDLPDPPASTLIPSRYVKTNTGKSGTDPQTGNARATGLWLKHAPSGTLIVLAEDFQAVCSFTGRPADGQGVAFH